MMRSDVVIFGNGVAANAMAVGLANKGVSSLLVAFEGGFSNKPSVGEHLPPNALPLFRQLSIADIPDRACHQRSGGIVSRWGTDINIPISYTSLPHGDGWNLERSQFDLDIRAAADKLGAVRSEVIRLVGLISSTNGWRIKLKSNNGVIDVATSYMIDATGRATVASRRAGAKVEVYDSLVGMVGRIPKILSKDNRLHIEAVESGWWYFVRITGERAVAVLMTDADLMPVGDEARKEFWIGQLKKTASIKHHVGQCNPDFSLEIVDARTQRLSTMAGDNWFAIGDAAMAFDPVSAAGITKAVKDAASVCNLIVDHNIGKEVRLDGYLQKQNNLFDAYIRQKKITYQRCLEFRGSEFWARRIG